MRDVIARVQLIESRCRVAEDGPEVTRRLLELLDLRETRGKQVHDANVVATMLAHGVATLLTHNVDDFARWANLVGVQPLG